MNGPLYVIVPLRRLSGILAIFFLITGAEAGVETKNGDVLGLEIENIDEIRIKITNVIAKARKSVGAKVESVKGALVVGTAGTETGIGIVAVGAKIGTGGPDHVQGTAGRVGGPRLVLEEALGWEVVAEVLEVDLAGSLLPRENRLQMLILPLKRGMLGPSSLCSCHSVFEPEMSRNSFLLSVKSKM